MPRVIFVTAQEWERLYIHAYQAHQTDRLLNQTQAQSISADSYGGRLVTATEVWLGKHTQRRLKCWSLVPVHQYAGKTIQQLDADSKWAHDFHGLLVLHQNQTFVLDNPVIFLIQLDKNHHSNEKKIASDLATMPLF